jgi:hypothetical protein
MTASVMTGSVHSDNFMLSPSQARDYISGDCISDDRACFLFQAAQPPPSPVFVAEPPLDFSGDNISVLAVAGAWRDRRRQ